jgi:hypothetical protein
VQGIGAASAATELNELEQRLGEEQQQVAQIQARIRAAENEIATWRPARKRVLHGGARLGFVVGLTTTMIIGRIVVEVLAR